MAHEWSSEELDFALLTLVGSEPGYCYGLVVKVQEQLRTLVVGTRVYRNLNRLEERGYLVTWWASQENNPPKKVYRLTGGGQEYLRQLAGDWRNTILAVDTLLARAEQNGLVS